MKKIKSTKRALLMSALSLLMCMTMFIGSTFAWFTDSVTSAGNKIVAGNLKVDLIHAHYPGNTGSAIKTSLKENPDHKIFDYALWEPGHTQVEYFQIINKGKLHFQYEMRFTAQGALTALADVIEVYGGYPTAAHGKDRNEALKNMQYLGTVADIMAKGGKLFQGNTGGFELKMDEPVLAYAIALHMKEEAGNDYQDLSLFEGEAGFNVTLLATQMENEFDSFGNDYDRFADYDGEISGAASLEAALTKGGTYKVKSNIALDETVIVPAGVTVALDLNGNALTGNVELAAGSDATIVNGTIKNEDSAVSGIQNNGGNLTLEDVEIESARHAVRVEGGTVTIDGGVYKASGTKGVTQHALNVSDGAIVTINGGTFVGPKGTDSDSGAAVNVQTGSTVIINGGNFSGGKNNTLASNGTLSVYGGTFDQDPSKYVAEGYEVIKNAEGTYTISMTQATVDNMFKDAGNGDTVTLSAGTYKLPAAVNNKELTIKGTKDTKIDVSTGLTYINGSKITFDGVTIKSTPGTGYNYGFADAEYTVFNNCTIEGSLGLDYSCEFNNCEFNISGNNYNIWTWGAGTANFTGCTFNCDGKAMLVYANVLDNNSNHQTVNITDCVFNDNGDDTVTGKAAIEITNTYVPVRTYDVFITNTQVNGFAQTVPGADDFNAAYGSVAGSNIGTNVWGNKCELPNTQINVVIDGVDVY